MSEPKNKDLTDLINLPALDHGSSQMEDEAVNSLTTPDVEIPSFDSLTADAPEASFEAPSAHPQGAGSSDGFPAMDLPFEDDAGTVELEKPLPEIDLIDRSELDHSSLQVPKTEASTSMSAMEDNLGSASDDFAATPDLPAIHLASKDPASLDQVRAYADNFPVGQPDIEIAFPFSLLIEGKLTSEEQEKLLDVLQREKMGIREMDLEPQFAAGKVLIPRISEYAGVLIVQALRTTRARMRLGPTDEIFTTHNTRSETSELAGATRPKPFMMIQNGELETANQIPVTTESSLPGGGEFQVLDVVTASAVLKTPLVVAEKSVEYQELLERLQEELKHKAYHKGAHAILNFEIDLKQLHLPSEYRLTVFGSAVKAGKVRAEITRDIQPES